MTPRNVSRGWVRRYLQPRTPAGAFAPGFELWTRADGQSRWVHRWEPDAASERHLSDRERLALFLIASALWALIVAAICLR